MSLRLSPTWIKSFCSIEATTDEMAAILSQTGFETEVIDDLYIDPNIVIGEIVSCEKHPDAEKLNVCKVNVGSETLNIVCGCPSVVQARFVLVAKVGSKLPGIEIKEAKLRGVVSQGMICALNEIGLSDKKEGIYHIHEPVEVGTKLIDWISHDNQLLEIDVTPNRGDCLSVYGIARDLAASQGKVLSDYPKGIDVSSIPDKSMFEVKTKDVPCYGAMELTINPRRKTPLYILNRLRQAGMGSNHLVVDILNYIMLEMGQPMHGFDQESLRLPLSIHDDEESKCALLDGTVYETKPWDILVCDQKGPQALGGIMGGFDSRLQETSEKVQLEAAQFSPRRIAKTLRRCNITSDASYMYERGVDPTLNEVGLSYAARLLVEYADAEIKSKHFYKTPLTNKEVDLDVNFINANLGITLDANVITEMLLRLGLDINNEKVTIPHYRHDINEPVDLVEEVARLYGYNNIPLTAMQDTLEPKVLHEDPYYKTKVKLAHMGYHEVAQFSFVSKALLNAFPVNVEPIELTNPINAEYGFMRTHLWQSLIMAAQYNYQRQQSDLKIFEVGSVFHLSNEIKEPKQVAALAYGQESFGFLSDSKTVDYFHMQLLALEILSQYDANDVRFVRSGYAALHPNQSADVLLGEVVIGSIGMLHPKLALELGLPETGLLCIDLEKLKPKPVVLAKKPSKYPAIKRSITVTVDPSIPLSSLEEKIKGIPNMVSLELVCIYRSDEHTQKITWEIKFQSDAETLSDGEIDKSMKMINDLLEQ